MKAVDITPLIDNDRDYAKLARVIEERYQCDWDDPVHDSYRSFERETTRRAEQLHALRCKAETLVAQMEGINIEKLTKEAEILRAEAQNV